MRKRCRFPPFAEDGGTVLLLYTIKKAIVRRNRLLKRGALVYTQNNQKLRKEEQKDE